MGYTLNFATVWANFDKLLGGLGLGLLLALASVSLGSIIGLVCGFASVSSSRTVRSLVSVYVTIIRNEPIYIIVLMIFFALPDAGLKLNQSASFITALTVYSGAYLSEVFRAGLISVPKGVVEAARAIGLTRLQTSLYVVTPIMLRNALPALGSTFISLFKDTSIAATIAIPELTYQARKINIESFRIVETWTVASALYIATCLLMAAALRGLERRFPKF
ncbi:amino acid ABC transporter permease [Labrys monachus]|uniref:Polar amino acid transport system permease protein n=1 Tax=Labrys monachus TaxID=217067 RepID=A0ABU0FGS7_9HYPH|nr:amino acid ABC transporter permease [Labrys monachus]MDQ0393808.1 polar amino acid transport system permease protein [Labrys monachus]